MSNQHFNCVASECDITKDCMDTPCFTDMYRHKSTKIYIRKKLFQILVVPEEKWSLLFTAPLHSFTLLNISLFNCSLFLYFHIQLSPHSYRTALFPRHRPLAIIFMQLYALLFYTLFPLHLCLYSTISIHSFLLFLILFLPPQHFTSQYYLYLSTLITCYLYSSFSSFFILQLF